MRLNLWPIIAGYFPDAIIADRTALEGVPAKDGSVFLVSQGAQSDVSLPGFTLRPRRGAPAQVSDLPFMGVLRLSSRARCVLDNFAGSRSRGTVSRTLTRREIETYLDHLLRHSGGDELNRLRDEARALAPAIGREKEFAALNRMVGALLNTQEDRLQTPAARAQPGHGVRSGAPRIVRDAARRTAPDAAANAAADTERQREAGRADTPAGRRAKPARSGAPAKRVRPTGHCRDLDRQSFT